METLANLESFARSAEAGSFSAAARRLGLTPAAVSRNVALLESNLGVRLFLRSTRKLTLTEAGERFLVEMGGNLDALQAAIASVSRGHGEPAGVLKVSLPPTIGTAYVLPLLPAFLASNPMVRIDWHFDNRQVDLIGEGYDAALGGGLDLASGVVSRALAPAHLVAVASPAYMAGREPPVDPGHLAQFDGIVMRSSRTGRVQQRTMRDTAGNEMLPQLRETIVLNDPAAMREAAILGLGVALLAVSDVRPSIERGELTRVLPRWYVDAGSISIYYATRALLPAKTRVFIDFVAGAFERERFAEKFAANIE
ncbi:LysR family transcriptional regulator [Paraburkholderia bannensis]|uniref:LysR family transcriptional regulator n=1 Tax=Paraburkholderia bannensis TaxID=765414 RepID=UPI002AC35154|nr:LysR family transcriptional regulator [Paraburkholderia bannensis]